MTTPTCPHCGAKSAVPILGLGDKIPSVFKSLFGRGASVASFANAHYVRQFETGQIEAVCTRCGKRFKSTADANRPAPRAAAAPRRAVTERLRELEALRSQSLITDDEYREQRQRILADL
ncbi:MAG: SHOCT domain-containing protein [Anaerolineales bacterium]|nr:SHOCT domain-containing protein [Anaerolineales bacterium]